ncbi:L-iditol 2-dehydrogenase [Eremomyces bilateralis CBS 781.70]|uniref:L-iditol 2-dehydrogenase n=1 Tax=Eremomyces bilateralis CBS 781.70 TaxID=1392243 RepID=A0A6G1GG95_9PEZI|nr:L-iditol 2-dehydrogenase [Eremomyces bilateralis CBS 781.70]KAF1816931.1 L-iditol 2-dehydrogenase [Eremomyces bilateralis CBS 781.70]
MKAAQFHGARDIRISSVPVPTPKSNQVLVDIEWCGICGSDLHEYLKGPLVIPTEENPHKITGEALPVTLGHEFCGRISWAPDGSELKVGQPVMVDPRLYCTSCLQCENTRTNMCQQWGFLGLSGTGGGLSETVAVDANACHVLPEGVDLRFAALIEPLTVARHALKSSGLKFESLSVLVLGGGPVGVAVAMDLKVHGTHQIIVSEPSLNRRNQVAKYCDAALDPMEALIADECRKLTGGTGVDVVFDCAGVMPALRTGFDALRNQGTYVNVAGWGSPLTVPMEFFQLKEIVFRASMSYDEEDFVEVVKDFTTGRFPAVEDMVTSRIKLEDVAQRGFEELVQNKDYHIKILVTPKPELLT